MRCEWRNLISLEYGKPVQDKESTDGPVPVFGTNGKIGTSHLPPHCPHASFILGRKGAYRGVHYSNVPFSVIDTAFYAKNLTPDKLSLKWAYYKFLTYDINSMDSGSAIPSTDRYEIYAIEVELPTLDEQLNAIRLLEALDNKIELNRRIHENLERQAQAVFQHLFVDNALPEWREGTISDLGTVIGGSTPSKTRAEYYTEKGIAWITPKDLSISKSKFITHGEHDITELGLKNSSAALMPAGTVLFSSRAPIGYIAIADDEVTTNQGFKSVVPKPEIGTAYVYYFLKQNLPAIEGMASGSTFKEVSGAVMKSVPAQIPDDETLAKFNGFCGPLFAQQKRLEQESRSLAALRDILLPRLMAGKIDLSAAPHETAEASFDRTGKEE